MVFLNQFSSSEQILASFEGNYIIHTYQKLLTINPCLSTVKIIPPSRFFYPTVSCDLHCKKPMMRIFWFSLKSCRTINFGSSTISVDIIHTIDHFALFKDQLISKGLLAVFNSSKKRKTNFCPNRLGQKLKFSNSFFEIIEDNKKTFRN